MDKFKEIKKLGLSVRARNVLYEANLLTKEKIIEFHKKQSLGTLRNCGPVSLKEIIEAVDLPDEKILCPKCRRPL